MIIAVALPVPLYQTFDYECQGPIEIGQRVWVKFQHRESVGVVIELKSDSDYDYLETVISIIDTHPIISQAQMAFLRFSSSYYAEPIGMVMKASLPAAFRKNAPLPNFYEVGYRLNSVGEKALIEEVFKRAKKQKALATYLKSTRKKSDLSGAGFSSALLKKLVNYVDEVWVNPYSSEKEVISQLSLTDEQQHVYHGISQCSDVYTTHLIHGVTGSGKTEIYLRLIADAIERNQQVLMLVPEIGLTPQTYVRMTQRFAQRVAVSHSGISDNQRAKLWLATSSGELPILIGTRSAIFNPFRNLGLIIVDEEHDDSYKQSEGFSYNARDLAISLAKRRNIPIVLGSATPSLAMLANVRQGKATLHKITSRIGEIDLPRVSFIDMRTEKKRSGVAEVLINELQQRVRRKEQVLLFINRRGYAPVLKCEQCDWASQCRYCDSYLTTHLSQRQLVCHHCGARRGLPIQCPDCASDSLYHAGAGTEKIEQILKEQVPFARILRLDRDNQTTEKQLNQALDKIHDHEVDIIIGTQLIAKGHHFAKLSAVCILDSDGGLYSGDYRSEERLLQQIVQVAGRAGREKGRGEVYIQSSVPQHPLFQAVLTHDYMSYAETLLIERRALELPPFTGMVLFKASYRDEAKLREFLTMAKDTLTHHLSKQVKCLGPAPALIARRNKRYYYHLILLAPSKALIQHNLPLLIAMRSQLDKSNRFRIRIDVDPYHQY